MEAVIAKCDFVHAKEDMDNQLIDEFDGKPEEYAKKMKVNDMKKVIETFVKKVCVQPFPGRNSEANSMCSTVLRNITEVLELCESEYNTITKKQCQGLIFDLMVEFISKGHGSTHFELIGDMATLSEFDISEYLQEIRGKELKRLLEAIKQQRYVKEKDIDIDEYASAYKSNLERVIEEALGSDEKSIEPDIHAEFLDLYLFYLVAVTKNPEGMADDLSYCQNAMWYKYDRRPYMGCKDMALFKRHFSVFKDILQNKTFPRFEKEKEMVTESVDHFLDGVGADANILKSLWVELNDFFTNLAADKRTDAFADIMDKYNTFFEKFEETGEGFDTDLFESWAPKFIEMLNKSNSPRDSTGKQVRKMLEKTTPKKGHEKYWIPILCGLLRFPTKNIAYEAENLINFGKLKKIWKWKENIEGARQIVAAAAKADIPLEEGSGWDNREIAGHYGKTVHELFEQLELLKISHLVMGELANLIISGFEKRSTNVNNMLYECGDNLNFKKNLDLVPDFVRRYSVLFLDEDYAWSEGWTQRPASKSLEAVINGYSDGKDIPAEVNEILVKMLLFAMDEDTERIDLESRSINIYAIAIRDVLLPFVSVHSKSSTAEVLTPLLPSIHRLMDDDNDDVKSYVSRAMSDISSNAPKLLAVDDEFDRLIQRYVDDPGDDFSLLSNIYGLYTHNTGAMAKRFQDVFATLGKNKDSTHMLFALMWQISEKQPEIFTRQNVNTMSSYLGEENIQAQILMVWDKIAEKNPDFLLDQVDVIMNHKKLQPPTHSAHFVQGILSNVAVKHKKYLDPVIDFFIKWLKKDQSQLSLSIFYGLKKLADKFGPEPFAPYRQYLDEFKKSSSSYHKDAVTSLIDTLENRSLETVSTDVKQVKEDVDELDERVTGTEVVVGGVVKQVERHEGEITDVKEGVTKVNKRVDDVEDDLGEVKEKVEEIDMKTMSNAPTWSRDLTKLLNPKSDHDWRLLASRLGYTNDDIRAWSTQSDPCMALLSEWYATHKTIEATSAVLNILQEMNRLDAAVIVENAMKKAEDVVEDEEFEYPSPPPVFLSYQWGHQNEVKLLRQHLEMAGYLCWMDVGQMGGGDKLFEKIDAGIRGAKVVICCVSEKYAKSPNCNREVNLAVNLRKPMIPLQMEKIAWPPVGSMGPIFSEYLYIRFYSGGKNGKYWADQKFQEILMQLQFNGLVPDEKLITKEYKNWWLPVAEEIIITKKDDKPGVKSDKKQKPSTDEQTKEETPEVFLSYQWDKQKQIQALYKRLTGLGLTCWMDIHQMGGGDSLYDKIDRGVRGCKVVLSSVTQKYSLSANCRREVSLADALKKPIIPLLLEDVTWPPSGPMSMVFTQLIYINFFKNPNIQINWKGKEFDELMTKLNGYLPELDEGKSSQNRGHPNSKGAEKSSSAGKKSNDSISNTPTTKKVETAAKEKPAARSTDTAENQKSKPTEQDKGKPIAGKADGRPNNQSSTKDSNTSKLSAGKTNTVTKEKASEPQKAKPADSKTSNQSPVKQSSGTNENQGKENKQKQRDDQQPNKQIQQKSDGAEDKGFTGGQVQNASSPPKKSSTCDIL